MSKEIERLEEESAEELAELLALAGSFEDEDTHKKMLGASNNLLKASKTLERQMAIDEAKQDHEVALFYLTEYLDRCHQLENRLACITKIAREIGDI